MPQCKTDFVGWIVIWSLLAFFTGSASHAYADAVSDTALKAELASQGVLFSHASIEPGEAIRRLGEAKKSVNAWVAGVVRDKPTSLYALIDSQDAQIVALRNPHLPSVAGRILVRNLAGDVVARHEFNSNRLFDSQNHTGVCRLVANPCLELPAPNGREPWLIEVLIDEARLANFSLATYSSRDFLNEAIFDAAFYGGFFVALLVMIAYQGILGIYTRHIVYFRYSTYLLGIFCVYIVWTGWLGIGLAWMGFPTNGVLGRVSVFDMIFVSCLVMYASFSWFVATLLPESVLTPWRKRILLIIAAASLFALVLQPFLSPLAKFNLANGVSSVMALYALYLGVRGSLLRDKASIMFLVSFLILGFFIMLLNLKQDGVISPGFFSTYGVHIGTIIEVVALSLILGDRLMVLTRAKDSLQHSLAIAHFAAHEQSLQSQLRVKEAQREQLGKLSLHLCDSINSPLTTLYIVKDALHESIDGDAHASGMSAGKLEEMTQMVGKLDGAVAKISTEIGSLRQYLQYAPSSEPADIRQFKEEFRLDA